MIDPFARGVEYDIPPVEGAAVNESGIIVFDTETTGLSPETDEILQISVIDGHGSTMIDQLVRPIFKEEWPKAQEVHHIAPADLLDKPTAMQVAPDVIQIFRSAKTWVAYNGQFDLGFLEKWGVVPDPDTEIIDVMREFAPIYGEPGRFGGFKWQKLCVAANYYCYDWGPEGAHNALADCRATLHVYRSMRV